MLGTGRFFRGTAFYCDLVIWAIQLFNMPGWAGEIGWGWGGGGGGVTIFILSLVILAKHYS